MESLRRGSRDWLDVMDDVGDGDVIECFGGLANLSSILCCTRSELSVASGELHFGFAWLISIGTCSVLTKRRSRDVRPIPLGPMFDCETSCKESSTPCLRLDRTFGFVNEVPKIAVLASASISSSMRRVGSNTLPLRSNLEESVDTSLVGCRFPV